MQGLSTQRAPHPSVVLPHFAFGAVSFLVLSIVLIFSTNELAMHYFQPKILALTHIATLGWITMIIFGALYQLIPVVLEVPLFSEKLAKICFWLLALGTLLLVHAFWLMKLDIWLVIPATMLLIVFILFAINVLLTAKKTIKWNIESSLIMASVFWILTTAVLGFLISMNFHHGFLKNNHLIWLKVHSNTGLVGWIFFLIMGVGSKLIPMFLLSHKLNKNKLKYAFYAVNAGLVFFFIDNAFLFYGLDIVAFLIIASGLIGFVSYIYEAFKKRARKNLDIGLKHTAVSILMLFIPVILAFITSLKPELEMKYMLRLNIVYVVSMILGFITSLILGQTFKTLPFIVWLSKYQSLVGKVKTPLPKDLYSEKLLNWQYWSYNLSIALLFIGLIGGIHYLVMAGSYILLFVAVLYNINIFKILSHKVKKEEIKI